MKASIKKWIGPTAGPALYRLARESGRPAGVVLLYHKISPLERDSAKVVVPSVTPTLFGWQLDYVARHYDVVPLEGLLREVETRSRGDRTPVSITFDDDSREHVECALPQLRKRGLPATFFLCGSFVSADASEMWWEALQRALDKGVPVAKLASALSLPVVTDDPHAVNRIATAIEELDPASRDAASASLRVLAGPGASAGLSSEDVGQILEAGCEIGFHTVRHDRLTELDDGAVKRNLSDGRHELEELVRKPIRTVAYPHGRADARVARIARRSGYALGVTMDNRAIASTSDPMLMGRLNVSQRSRGAFAWELARASTTLAKD